MPSTEHPYFIPHVLAAEVAKQAIAVARDTVLDPNSTSQQKTGQINLAFYCVEKMIEAMPEERKFRI